MLARWMFLVAGTNTWRRGYIRVAVFRGGESELRDRYDTILVARPDKRRKRDGTWADSKISKQQRSVHVIASVFGKWYYLGLYQCQGVERLDPRAYDMLEPMVNISCGRLAYGLLTLY